MARSKNFFFGKLLRYDPTRGSYSLKTEVGENVSSTSTTSVRAADSADGGGNILPDGWTFSKDANNKLVIKYNSTPVVSIADSGEVTTITDLVGYGSI
jgi:hypothetical protein